MLSSSILVGFVVVVLVYLFNYFRVQLHKCRDINKLPGPSTLNLLWEIISNKSPYEKYQFMSNLNKEYGPAVKLWIKPFRPIILVADVEFVDKLLMSKHHLKKSEIVDLFKPYLGEGIGTTNKIDLWKKSRKICNTAFQYNTVIGLLPIITKYTNQFLESLKNRTGEAIETQSLMHLFALDIVFECLTKQIYNFQDNNNSLYVNARSKFFEILTKRLFSVFLANELLFKFSSNFKIMNKALLITKKFTQDIANLKEMEEENGGREHSKQHLIDVLYANNIRGEFLSNQINTFTLAAHDTVTQAMCYALYELSKHKEIQQKLFEEITSLVGEDSEITSADLQNMRYLEAVIKEVLRMYTLLPIIERIVGHDININGVNYPAGTRVLLNLQAINSSEKYYQNPAKFDPERFMPENAHLIQKNSFVTFSLGPRNCIGKVFAMLVIKLFLANAVQTFELLPVQNHKLEKTIEVIIKSKNGIPVIFKKRSAT